MINIKIIFFEHDEFGEAQGVFDENDNLIGSWYSNDGEWRHEYFNPVLAKVDVNVAHEVDNHEELLEKFCDANGYQYK